MFKKDDYIVGLKIDIGPEFYTDCMKKNFIIKQRLNSKSIYPCVDLAGNGSNGNDRLSFDGGDKLLEWRYATLKEIEEYDRRGKPYNVTEIPMEDNYPIFN